MRSRSLVASTRTSMFDGLSLLRSLREKGRDMHVLILSAKDTVEDRVAGLRAGADDYLVKPFAFEELLARVGALGRREHGRKRPILTIGGLSVDTAARKAYAAEEEIDLTRREFALLEYLALNSGRAIPRAELEEHIYDERSQPWSNAIDSAVSALRRKLRRAGLDSVIRTRRGVGYSIEPDPERLRDGP